VILSRDTPGNSRRFGNRLKKILGKFGADGKAGTMGTIENFALLGDSPVLEAGREDWLGYGATAIVLARAAIETSNPLTIGVFGEWGTGKTSLMRLIQREVDKDENTAAVWFNAWQYEKEEHLIVPLVATINKELDKDWKAEIKEGAKKLRDALRAIAYGFSVKGKVGIPLISEAEVNLSGKDMIARYQELTKDSVLDRSLYFDAFEKLKECVKQSGAPRIVIFVDDLDRCMPDKAVQLLEGIKLILHQPGFSFVLGLNEVIIDAYIKTKYEKELKIEGTHYDDYLDKMVQVKIPVPARDTKEMEEYIERLLNEGKIFDGKDKAAFIPLIADACNHNPRKVVRLLNRIMVTSRIGAIEKKPYDPEGLLLDIATDEPRYRDFREALDVTVIFKDTSEAQTIGQFLAKTLEGSQKNRHEWNNDMRAVSLLSMQEIFNRAIDVIKENEHLFQLLKSTVGREWLSNSTLRNTLRKAAERTRAEKRGEEESPQAAKAELSDPIQTLLKNMVPISGGTFNMGSEEYDREKPVHEVTLSAFEIGATQVTQAQYEAVMGKGINPSYFKHPDNPVETVSWEEAKAFCEELSKLTRKKFVLPTEAQWEYACRAGSDTRFCFVNEEDKLEEYAWYNKNSEGRPHAAGRMKPNAWGLYDMHGNVWEWCNDWYGEYSAGPQTDPEGPASGPGRVLRGGSWSDYSGRCRSASRYSITPGTRSYSMGFRVVRIP